MLIDFNLAEEGEYLKASCGTYGYLPPETFEENKTRGSPGDIWALGVTALQILWKIAEPPAKERYQVTLPEGICSDFLQKGSPSYYTMQDYLKDIYSKRDQLDLADEVEGLVFKMLQRKSEARIKAADIEMALKGSFSGNKRKHN